MYKTEPVSYPSILRPISTQGTDQGMIYVPPGIRTYESVRGVPGAVPGHVLQRDGILLQGWSVHLAAASGTDVGIGFRYGPNWWKVGRLSAANVYTDLTDTAQARTAITLQTAGADQTGFVVLSPKKFGWVSLTMTTAETNAGGGTVVDHGVQYSNSAGTGWTAVAAGQKNTDNFTTTNTVWAGAPTLYNFVWQPPADWGAVTSLGTIPPGFYALSFTSVEREANDVAAVATGIEVGILDIAENVTQYQIYAAEKAQWWEPAADGIVAYFSAADGLNKVSFICRPMG